MKLKGLWDVFDLNEKLAYLMITNRLAYN